MVEARGEPAFSGTAAAVAPPSRARFGGAAGFRLHGSPQRQGMPESGRPVSPGRDLALWSDGELAEAHG